jgi:hypothetical protein
MFAQFIVTISKTLYAVREILGKITDPSRSHRRSRQNRSRTGFFHETVFKVKHTYRVRANGSFIVVAFQLCDNFCGISIHKSAYD